MQTETASRIEQLTDAALEQLQHNLAAGRSETLTAYLATMAKFHRYSFGNQLLIFFQRPDATQVAGFHTWRKMGRFVNKGEKGIVIIAPCARKVGEAVQVDANGTEQRKDVRKVMGFRGAHVFDVSQTSGADLPEFAQVTGDPREYQSKLEAMIAASGITFTRSTFLGGAHGLSSGGAIQVLEGLEPAYAFSVTVHEYAHELMHRTERRKETTVKIRETEAEAAAYVVCSAIGLDVGTQSSDYLSLYNGDRETLMASLEVIRNTAAQIISGLNVTELAEMVAA
jgi:hypothetical protein